MPYSFHEIEKKWQEHWEKNKTFQAKNPVDVSHASDGSAESSPSFGGGKGEAPKFYVLDMFPYPSGSGLHVGHPLGYIATDIFSRYKRLKGFNVLHPMGFDAFGLPAEQYAIQTGQHPAVTTEKNIERYRNQLKQIGLSFDWSREVRTCDPSYYKWTQWIFLKLFSCWYNNKSGKAEPIETLIEEFERNGNREVDASCTEVSCFTAQWWNQMTEPEKQEMLLNYRLAYLSETMVNWCPELGTVLANEEVTNGLSDRGGHPVERKLMKQWQLRITAYAERLLSDLEKIDWPSNIREMQRNWIGRSEGALVKFRVDGHALDLEIFTTRPDTLFGVTFMVLAPEHPHIEKIAAGKYREGVLEYAHRAMNRTERDRLAGAGKISGKFTGAYCIHPFTGQLVQIWVSDYVLAGYGTGAIMAVPAHDTRDYSFAKHFNIPIKKVIRCGENDPECYDGNDGVLINSDFINGLGVRQAINRIIVEIEKQGIGRAKVNYKLHDAVFSRQRYWGEPFPVYYKNGVPYPVDEHALPVTLPKVDKYLPTETGDPPLARAKEWKTPGGYPYEHNTMPGWAGSSWYYLRYEDPHNENVFASSQAVQYWQNVDIYLGGAEHATGHLLYVRFWTKFLHDLGYLPFDEPAKKLINQGMILGEDGEKMSKSRGNVINPDDVINEYGADTFRLYEMFLGPLEQAKPWDTRSIEGVHRFLKKVWRLYHSGKNESQGNNPDDGVFLINGEPPSLPELKILHRAIKKVQDDIEHFAFNTAVSALMVCVNELTDQKCFKKGILETLAILLSPFAPHLAEELWEKMGHRGSISYAPFPDYSDEYLKEDVIKYPVQFNGKMRFMIELPIDYSPPQVEAAVLAAPQAARYLNGNSPRKIIVVPGKIVNVVV